MQYCFSTVTVVTRTRLNVVLYVPHLSGWLLQQVLFKLSLPFGYLLNCGVFRPDVCVVTMKMEAVRFSETSHETKCATLPTDPKDAQHIIT